MIKKLITIIITVVFFIQGAGFKNLPSAALVRHYTLRPIAAKRSHHKLHVAKAGYEQALADLNRFMNSEIPVINPSLTTLTGLLKASRLQEFLEKAKLAEKTGAGSLHLDIFDPNYVETEDGKGNMDIFNAELVRHLVKATSIPIDVHLMVRPSTLGGVDGFKEYIAGFIKNGASFVSIHWGAFQQDMLKDTEIQEVLKFVRDEGACAGLVINPDEDAKQIIKFQEGIDFTLVMSVIPGAGGRSLDERAYANLNQLQNSDFDKLVEIDGGIKDETIAKIVKHGGKWLVVGSYYFGKGDNLKTEEQMAEAHEALITNAAKSSSAGSVKKLEDPTPYLEEIAEIGTKAFQRRLVYLRGELGIYPGDNFLVASKLMCLPSKELKRRVKALDDLTVESYNRRFDFNRCPVLLTLDEKAYYSWIEKLNTISKRKGLKGLRAEIRKDVEKHSGIRLKGEILQEYYPEFQDPAFEFVDLEEEFELAEKEHREFERMGKHRKAEFEHKNQRLKKRFKTFFMARPESPQSLEYMRHFLEHHKKPHALMRAGVIKGEGDIYIFKAPGKIPKRFSLGGGRWDPIKGVRVRGRKRSKDSLYSFTQYKDRTKRRVWINAVLLKGGKRGIIIYLRKRGKPVGFAEWNEETQEFDRVFGPVGISCSDRHISNKPLLTKWLESQVRIKGRFRVVTKPWVMKKKKVVKNGKVVTEEQKGVYILTDVAFLPEESIEEPEAIIESVVSAKKERSVNIYGMDNNINKKHYGQLYYRKGSFLDLQKEAVVRFSDWDGKSPAPEPIMVTLKNEDAEVKLQRIQSGGRNKLIPAGRGIPRGLKKGDNIWVEFFSYGYKGRLHKAARVFKLNEDLIPACEVFNVWYDEKKERFNEIEGFQAHLLTPLERFKVSWKIFWFGWIDNLSWFDVKSFSTKELDRLILDKLKRQPLTARDLGEEIAIGLNGLFRIKAALKRLRRRQKIVHVGYGKFAYLDKEVKVKSEGYIYINGHDLSLRHSFLVGDRLRVATESGWPIMLYEVYGNKVRTENPFPVVVQRDERGDIIKCFSRDIPLDALKGKTYFENIYLPEGGAYKDVAAIYEIYLNHGIEKETGHLTATLFFDGERLKEIHFWRGDAVGMYHIKPGKEGFTIDAKGSTKPRKILRKLGNRKNILCNDPGIEVWDNLEQLTENELRSFIWKQLEAGPKTYKELVGVLAERRYPHLDIERALKGWKGPADNLRVVTLPCGRYAVATKRNIYNKREIVLNKRKYSLPERWRKENYVWVVCEENKPVAVTGAECDFTKSKNVDYYIQFRDKDDKLLNTALQSARLSYLGSPTILLVYNLPFTDMGKRNLFGRDGIVIYNQINGKAVGKIASLILERNQTGYYDIRRVDFWNSHGQKYNKVRKKAKTISASVDSIPNISVVDIEGRCTVISPVAGKRCCQKREIINRVAWQKEQKRIKKQVDEHLRLARSLEKKGDIPEALEQYHLAFIADAYGENEVIRKKLINLSTRICLDEAHRLLNGSHYKQAQKLFEQAEVFVKKDKRRFNQSLAKARILAAYHEGMRFFEGGNYVLAKEKLEQVLSYRESLSVNFITKKEMDTLKLKLVRADALCSYMKARELFFKGRYDEALDMLEDAYSKKNGMFFLKWTLTIDIIKEYMHNRMARRFGVAERGALNDAINNAMRILFDITRHKILSTKEVIEEAIGGLETPTALAILKYTNVWKKKTAHHLARRLRELLESYDEKKKMIEAPQDELDDDNGDYEDIDGYYEEAESAGSFYIPDRGAHRYSLSKYYLKQIRNELPDFKPLSNGEKKQRLKKHFGEDLNHSVMVMLEKIENTKDWELLLWFILNIADMAMFTDNNKAAAKKRIRLEDDIKLATEGIKTNMPPASSLGLSDRKKIIKAILKSA